MALVIETGAIVTGADSFVERAAFITWAASFGVTITDDEDADVMLRKAAAFIGSLEPRLLGDLVERDQPLAYPRSCLKIRGFEYEEDEIPGLVLQLQQELTLDLQAGIDIYNPPAATNAPVKREKIEKAVEVEYAIADQQARLQRSMSSALIRAITKSFNPLNIATVSRG